MALSNVFPYPRFASWYSCRVSFCADFILGRLSGLRRTKRRRRAQHGGSWNNSSNRLFSYLSCRRKKGNLPFRACCSSWLSFIVSLYLMVVNSVVFLKTLSSCIEMGFADATAFFLVPQPGVCRKVTYIESLALFSFFSYFFFKFHCTGQALKFRFLHFYLHFFRKSKLSLHKCRRLCIIRCSVSLCVLTSWAYVAWLVNRESLTL